MDCPIRPEDLMSDVEPLALSAPSSAPASPRAGPATAPRSLPASPRSALSPSSLVTARLYASLQSCRQLEAGRRLALEITAADRGSAQTHAGARREPTGQHGSSGRPARDGPRPVSAPASSCSSSMFSSKHDRRGAELSSSTGPQPSHITRPASAIPGSQPHILSTDCPPGSRSAAVDAVTSRHLGLAQASKDAASTGRLTPQDLEALALEMTQKVSQRVETSIGPKAGSRHISEMESVRSHLQSMLRFSQDLTDRNDAINLADQQQRNSDSFESDCTSALLSAKAFQEISVSPPAPILGLDEAVLFPRYSRMQLGTRAGSVAESVYEYQILRDTLDKERTRRKHCEKQIQALQNKILALQQQLAVAVSADRKKDIMIEQLDKTLVKVVEGWKKHDEERSEAMRQLQEEHQAVERERGERQQAVLNFEHHLSQATQALAKEQEEKEQLEKEMGLLEEEARRLGEALQAEQRRGLALQAQCDKAEGGRLQERKQAEALHAQLLEERDAREQLEQRSSQQEAELQQDAEKERAARQREAQRAQDGQQVLSAVQTEMQRLEGELDAVSREKESLQMELSLVKARFESQRVKAETEFKVALEQQVTERLTTIHEDSTRQMVAIREQHRKQMMQLGTQHEHEMGRQLAQFKLEAQEREEKHRHVMEGYELRLAKGQEETGRLLAVRRSLEVQRNEMVSRLQAMMQSHWNEALKVLMSESLPHGPQRLQLLDRSPSEPVDTSSDAETLSLTPQGAETQKGGPAASPDESSGRDAAVRPQPAGQLSSGRAAGSAVHKVKVGRTESVPTQRGHPPQHPHNAGGVLSPKQVGELSRLLGAYSGSPDCPVPSMDELFTYLRDHQGDRPLGLESLASSTQQNQSHRFIPAAKNEEKRPQPSAQKLLNTNRPEHHSTNPGKEKKRPVPALQGGGGSREARTAIWR
ncbi:centrobin isoform X3 [Rhinoraja longicauda]